MTTEQNKVALVTGASRGIGKAIALALGKQGLIVTGTATTQTGAEKITEYLNAANIQGKGYELNVCDDVAIEKTLAAIQQDFAAPTILINNAGITRDNLLLRMKDDQWSDVINTNLNAVFKMTKLSMRMMMKARWGRIVNIASVVGTAGNAGQANYCASKAGVVGFSKAVAQEMAARNITCNVVAPGFIETDMTHALTDEQKSTLLEVIPMKRIGKPEEIADAVVFLVSDAASYITGHTLHVNGGMCMV